MVVALTLVAILLLPSFANAQTQGPSIYEASTRCSVGGDECAYGPNGSKGTCEAVRTAEGTNAQYCAQCTGTGDAKTCTFGTYTSYDPNSEATYPGVVSLTSTPSGATTCSVDSACVQRSGEPSGTCTKVRFPSTPRTQEYATRFCAIQSGSSYIFQGNWGGVVPGSNVVNSPSPICTTDQYCIDNWSAKHRCLENPYSPIKECVIPGTRPTVGDVCDTKTGCDAGYLCQSGLGPNGKGVCMKDPNSGPALVNLLKVSTLKELIVVVLGLMVQIGTLLLVLMLVVTGFKFVAAQGNAEEIQSARTALMWTVIGGLMLLGAQALSLVIKATIESL